MTDKYFDKKYQLHDAINLELSHLDNYQLKKVLQYCRTLAADQPKLFDTEKKCIVCGQMVFKPQRGPTPKTCSNRCRQKHYRKQKTDTEWQNFINS